MAGMVFVSAQTDALYLRSPHTTSNFFPFGRTKIGCRMPTCAMLSANSFNSFTSALRRGLKSLVTIFDRSRITMPVAFAVAVVFACVFMVFNYLRV